MLRAVIVSTRSRARACALNPAVFLCVDINYYLNIVILIDNLLYLVWYVWSSG